MRTEREQAAYCRPRAASAHDVPAKEGNLSMRRFLFIFAVIASGGPTVAQDDLVAAGEKVFIHCRGCHLVGDRKPVFTLAAPHLNDLFGRKPGSLPDRWRYSDQLIEFPG